MVYLTTILFYLSFVPTDSFAKNDIQTEACTRSAKAWTLAAEANETKISVKDVKIIESRALGSGSLLTLTSIFVDGPKTGTNTHWEVVGEFDYNKLDCKIVLGRRYWAH